MTYKHPWYTAQQQLESSTTSDVELTLSRPQVKPGQTHTDPNFKGDLYEHIAIVEAMKRGAYVYKNVGCSGKTDMIIQKGDTSLHVDVKAKLFTRISSTRCFIGACGCGYSGKVRWGRPRTIPTLWSEFWT